MHIAASFPSGWLDPSHAVDPDAVLRHLRDRDLLAHVVVRPPDRLAQEVTSITGTAPTVELSIAADAAEERALVLTQDGCAVGPLLADVVAGLAGEFRADVELGGEFATGREPDPETDDAPEGGPVLVQPETPWNQTPTVLLSRMRWEELPLLARQAGAPVRAAEIDGWVVAVVAEDADVSGYLWLRRDLPVVSLTTIEGSRYLGVVTERGMLPGLVLGPRAVGRSTFAPHEATGDAVTLLEWLGDPELAPGSTARQLLKHPAFAHVALDDVRALLDSPDDDGWFHRATASLGLPAVAADVAEGRGRLPGATEVPPGGLAAAILRSTDLSVDRGAEKGASAGWLQRWSATPATNPGRALALALGELALGGAVAWWAFTADTRPWWLTAIGVIGAVLVVDAVIDLAFLNRTLRRRAGQR